VLVVVSHPDDETIAAGGVVHAAVRGGARVMLVALTAGDGYGRAARRLVGHAPAAADYRLLGETRHAEMLAAAAALGVREADVACLGYPDGALRRLRGDIEGAGPVAGRSGSAVVPYAWAFRPGAPGAGNELSADLAEIVTGFGPTAVIGCDPRDTNADHGAASAFTWKALDDADYDGTRLGLLVHFGHYPLTWAWTPKRDLVPPGALAATAGWRRFSLSAADVAAKDCAVDAYASQTAVPDLRYFMRAFVRPTELFMLLSGPPTA
jgi:LmbE family N-acetylglucosaminyl deacetylase